MFTPHRCLYRFFWHVKDLPMMALHIFNLVWVTDPFLQACIAAAIIFAEVLFLFYARPYMDDVKDFLCCCLRVIGFALTLLGIVYKGEHLVNKVSPGDAGADATFLDPLFWCPTLVLLAYGRLAWLALKVSNLQASDCMHRGFAAPRFGRFV